MSAVLRANICVGLMVNFVIVSCDVAASATSRSRLTDGHNVVSEVNLSLSSIWCAVLELMTLYVLSLTHTHGVVPKNGEKVFLFYHYL